VVTLTLTLAAPVAVPAVPPSLVRLLERHDPVRAERVARLSESPPPDTVLVLGAAELAAGRLAAALAGRVPGLVRCAPAGEAALRPARVAETRAVVWVFDAAAPTPADHWAVLARLAEQVDEVHLALASRPDADRLPGHGDPAARAAAVRTRLAREVPRLADAPVRLLTDPAALVAALADPAEHPGYRNALRVLVTGLAEAAGRRTDRRRQAARREQATETALGRRADELAGRRRELTGESTRGARAELTALRMTTTQRLDDARRALRDQARDHLERADNAGRARFPELFATAAIELGEGALAEFDTGLTEQFDGRADPPTDPPTDPRTDPPTEAARPDAPAPTITPPGRSGRSALEERVMPMLGASGGLGLGRFLMPPLAEAFPGAQGAILPLAVGVGVAAACWLARARHAAADRSRLLNWAVEVLTDVRAAADAALAERTLAADRRLVALGERATEEVVDELRAHDRLVRRVAVRRAELAAADRAALAELDAALDRSDRLLDVPADRPAPARRAERAS
jgi:nicotinamide mononucleotide adenylyltransferase